MCSTKFTHVQLPLLLERGHLVSLTFDLTFELCSTDLIDIFYKCCVPKQQHNEYIPCNYHFENVDGRALVWLQKSKYRHNEC